MPQQDRHKERIIPIEFTFYDTLDKLPIKERCSIVLITCGFATIKINSSIHRLNSPCAICLSQYDTVELIHCENLSAKSFHFDPQYIKLCLCFDNLEDSIDIEPQYAYDRTKLYMFTKHTNLFQGIITLTPQNYIHTNELMSMIGSETYSQSDGFWTCRIRRMLLQLLNSLYDIFVDQRKLKFFETPESYNPATICAEYIHNHYAESITLSTLCNLVNLNRTSLNQKFKAQFSYTCMEYLLNYRLKISQELLSNSNMKIHEIAEACGFKYDSYFIKQFTAKLGISPAMYRKNPLTYSAYDGYKIKKMGI
ncbi:MAG: AraC family transcriptional regulator [Lachnoclostridium sp.]|nr:AraC family transcriptional regulator [Lachnospira sp.]MCM1248928.1 AraC family transcriptional regulator [Lachnoclostridium sp.]